MYPFLSKVRVGKGFTWDRASDYHRRCIVFSCLVSYNSLLMLDGHLNTTVVVFFSMATFDIRATCVNDLIC